MRWYVAFDGKTEGPLEENAVAILASAIGARLQVADEETRQWVPVMQSQFAANVPQAVSVADVAPLASPKVKQTSKAIWLILSGALVLVIALIAIALRPEPPPPPLPSVSPAVAELPAPPKELTLQYKLAETSSLQLAVQLLRPMFKDTQDEADPAARALALWCTQRLDWNSLSGLPETSRAKVMKDPEPERGKRLCASGTIIEIHNDRSSGRSIYSGGINTASFDIVRFYAVKSTGDLVEKSIARICGVVTGTETYSNSAGGVSHAVLVVGMFDLPENRQARSPSNASPAPRAVAESRPIESKEVKSLAGCCSALDMLAASAPEPNSTYYKQAAALCKTQDGNPAALGMIQGMLRGAAIPAACK
jgi:hypothetical protein